MGAVGGDGEGAVQMERGTVKSVGIRSEELRRFARQGAISSANKVQPKFAQARKVYISETLESISSLIVKFNRN